MFEPQPSIPDGKKKRSKKPPAVKTAALSRPLTPIEVIDNKLLLQTALRLTFTSGTGTFFDTKFYAFSRRKINGVLYNPKPVFANGWILRKRVPHYFEQREHCP